MVFKNVSVIFLPITMLEASNKNEDIGTAIKILTSLGDYKDSAKIVAERSGEEE